MGSRRCCVENCQSCSKRPEDQAVSFHKFPKNPETRKVWMEQCRIKHLSSVMYVCSRHFRKIDFQENKTAKFLLKLRALPTIFDWGITPYTGKLPGTVATPVVKKKTTHMRFSFKPPNPRSKSKLKKTPTPPKDAEPTPSTSEDVTVADTDVAMETPVTKSDEEKPAEATPKVSTPVASSSKENKKTKGKSAKKKPQPKSLNASSTEVTSTPSTDLSLIEVPVIKTIPINFTPGYRIEAQDFNGAWHSATIMEVDSEEREALIQFDKSAKTKGVADEWIPQDSVRLRSTQPIISLTGRYVEGDKVYARWSDSRKFGATISKVLENDYYTVLFDDGYVKNVRGPHISREKRPLSAWEREQLLQQAKAAKPSPKKVMPSTKQRPQLPPEVKEKELKAIDKDGEWCCHWINDIPVGKEAEVQVPSGKILTTIVDDWRLPAGWLKHMYQRGNIVGKWDVILQSPVGRVFRNKTDLKAFLEENGENYNQDIYDFSIHKRRAKDIGVCDYTKEYRLAMAAQQVVNSPVVASASTSQPAVTVKPEETELTSKITILVKETIGSPQGSPVVPGGLVTLGDVTTGNVLLDTTGNEIGQMKLDEVYVGALKVKVVDNLYCCPKEECLKTFRKENHLQIHIKHYHSELSKMLGVCPNMTDLAALRTTAEDDLVIEQPARVPRKSTSAAVLGTPTTADTSLASASGITSPSTPVVARKKPGPKPKSKNPDSSVGDISQDGLSPGDVSVVPRIKRKYTHSPYKKKDGKLLSPPILQPFSESGEVVAKEEKVDGTLEPGKPSDAVGVTSTPKPATGYSQAFDAFIFDPESMIKSHSVCKKVPKLALGEKTAGDPIGEPELGVGEQPSPRVGPPRKYVHHGMYKKRGRRPGTKVSNQKRPRKYPRLSADTSYPDSDETRHSFGIEPPLRHFGHPHFYNQSGAVFEDNSQTSNIQSQDNNSQYLIEGGEVIKIVSMRQEEIINCICNYFEEDGLMIQCELCLCWQHGICNGIERESQVPEKYVCYICRNPVRGRTSKRFVHDQDWLYEGKLPIGKYHTLNPKQAARFGMLKQSHQLTGNLLELKRYMHSLRVKINIAKNKDHPKMYLWAKKWETSPPRGMVDLQLSGIHPLGDGIKMETASTANDEASIGKSEQDNLKHSILAGLLSSPDTQGTGGEANDLETLANAALSQQQRADAAKIEPEPMAVVQPMAPKIPEPEAAINPGECQLKLLDHIQKQQKAAMARLDKIENEIETMELLDDKAELVESPMTDNYAKTKQTIQMLLRDLTQMKKIVSINSGYL